MASAALLAVLATRALEASKVARAAEPQAPRPGERPALRVGPSAAARPTRVRLGRLRQRLPASPSTSARPRPRSCAGG